jgi:hypothetical protein
MRSILVILVVLIPLIVSKMSFGASGDSVDKFNSMSKLIMISRDHGQVFIFGRWSGVADTRSRILIPKTNTAYVICDRQAMTCSETLALFYSPDEIDRIPYKKHDKLIEISHKYRIIEWTSSAILARDETKSAGIDLKISLSDERVERIYRETGAEGAKTGKPDVFRHWVLK